MIAMLVIWLLAIYGVATILNDLMMRWNSFYERAGSELRVHLHVYNSETCLEGTVRSLVHLSRTQGRPLHMIVYDYGSTDSSALILGALQRETPFLFDHVEMVSRSPISLVSGEQGQLTIDLRQGFSSAI